MDDKYRKREGFGFDWKFIKILLTKAEYVTEGKVVCVSIHKFPFT